MYHSEFGRRLRTQSNGSGRRCDPSASPIASSSTSLEPSLFGSLTDPAVPFPSRSSIDDDVQLSTSLPSEYHLADDRNAFELDSNASSSSRRNSSSSRLSHRPHTPRSESDRERSGRRGIQGDRFIPNRDGSDTQAAFQLMSNEPTTPNRHKRKISAADTDAQREEANETFTTLLSSELFGADSNAFAAAVGGRNGAGSGTPSPYGGGGIGGGGVGASGLGMAMGGGGTGGKTNSGRSSVHGSQPTTPTKRNIFRYGSKSPSSSISRSRSIGTLTPGRSNSGAQSEATSPSRRGSVTATGLFGGPPGSSTSASSKRNSVSLDSPQHDIYNASPVSLESQRVLLSPRRAYRALSKVPYKVLDAPELADDFYLNLVDWSSKNTLGVGLANCVYLWSAQTSNVTKLCEVERDRDRITSVNWSGRGDHLAVGLNSGAVQIWDAERCQLLRTFRGHSARVGSLAWNEYILSTGSRDRSIYHRDVRAPSQSIGELKGHVQEICGLKWNTATNQLASGGNDNKLFVWDGFHTVPLYRFSHHRAAVKAIAWSPHQNGLLASGGGTADMHIRFFNTITGTLLSEVDTGSQVCNLAWSRINNEIISTHGFSGGKVSNQVQVWRYPDMSQVATLMGHTMRVLYLAMSPDGDSLVSGAGDETLRFWDLNTSNKGLFSSHGSTKSFSSHGGTGSLNPFGKLR